MSSGESLPVPETYFMKLTDTPTTQQGKPRRERKKKQKAPEPLVLIGSTPRALAVFLCFVQLVCLGSLTGTSLFMAFVEPEGNGTTTQDISPSLVILAILCLLVGLEGFHDLFRTCALRHKDPEPPKEGVTWDFQNKLFTRAVVPFIAHTVLVFPLIFIFVLHSRGVEFQHLLYTLTRAYDDLLMYHIILVVINIFTGMCVVPYVHYSLKLGLYGREDVTLGYMFTKFFAVPFTVSTIIMDIMLVYMVGYLRTNSGAITFTVLYLFTSFPVMRFMFMFVFRGSQLYTERWLIALRASTVLHLGMCYLAGWVVLMMIVLEGTGADGFWLSVRNLTSKRSKAVYLHFAMYLLLLSTVAYRVFLAKLRKKGRAQKILMAVTGGNIPEAALERFEKDIKTNPLLRKDEQIGTSTGTYAASDESNSNLVTNMESNGFLSVNVQQ